MQCLDKFFFILEEHKYKTKIEQLYGFYRAPAFFTCSTRETREKISSSWLEKYQSINYSTIVNKPKILMYICIYISGRIQWDAQVDQ